MNIKIEKSKILYINSKKKNFLNFKKQIYYQVKILSNYKLKNQIWLNNKYI